MKEKDPAFLFYSKDFYEGTRTMLPKERACFVDLMIYQHQNGPIPNDMERISMYCSGIDEATLEATLKAKFKLTEDGWVNSKMCKVINERSNYTSKQSDNGVVGQFFKKAKSTLKAKEYNQVRDYVYQIYTKDKLSNELKKEGVTHEGLLEAMLKHLASEDVDVNEDELTEEISLIKKGVKPKDRIPSLESFIDYGLEKAKANGLTVSKTSLTMKYEAWKEADWINGNGQEIRNWKSSLLNTLQHLNESDKAKQQASNSVYLIDKDGSKRLRSAL